MAEFGSWRRVMTCSTRRDGRDCQPSRDFDLMRTCGGLCSRVELKRHVKMEDGNWKGRKVTSSQKPAELFWRKNDFETGVSRVETASVRTAATKVKEIVDRKVVGV